MSTLNEIEKKVLDQLISPNLSSHKLDYNNKEDWAIFTILSAINIGLSLRKSRLFNFSESVMFKSDGSPTIILEKEIELSLKKDLSEFCPNAEFIGEETGGTLTGNGYTLGIDPIDGTWSMLGHSETFTTVITVLFNKIPFLGVAMNPCTGELVYCLKGNKTRLIQIELLLNDFKALDLPLERAKKDSLLINFHPSRNSGEVAKNLYKAWKSKKINMIKSPGGSPIWALIDAARGSFNYILDWANGNANVFDLAAGCLIIEGAGGMIVDLNNNKIPYIGHNGLLIGSTNKRDIEKIIEIIK